jgi:hypothetical protein
MGMLGEIFVAGEGQLSRSVLQDGGLKTFDGMDFPGIEPVKLATLHTILIGAPLTDIDAVVDRCPPEALPAAEGGPWLFAIPDEVTRRLADLAEAERRTVAAEWGNTEEWAIDPEDLALFATVIDALCAVARRARSCGSSLYAWVSP